MPTYPLTNMMKFYQYCILMTNNYRNLSKIQMEIYIMVLGWCIKICLQLWNCRWEWCKSFSTSRVNHQWCRWIWLCCFEIGKQPCQKEAQKIFFYNYWASPDLHVRLKENCSFSTLRVNRIWHCPVSSENNLKKKGRGAVEEVIDINNEILFLCLVW